MKCLRPTGLVIVLVTLPLVVYTATLETTSRYTLEENIRFPLTKSDNINNSIKSNISSQLPFVSEGKDNFEFINEQNRTSRSRSKLSTKLQNNPSKLTLSNANTIVKRKTNSKLVTAIPTVIKSSIIRKNSSLTLNNTHKINVVASRVPSNQRITSKPTIPSRTVTSKLPIKLTKVGTKTVQQTTPRSKIKSTTRRIITTNSLSKFSRTTLKPKKKPTIHRIVTKWSDTPSEIKQNWYEEGVPYPNPNPEISSASPGVFLSSVRPISPLSNVVSPLSSTTPSPQPEITSYSPNYSPNSAVSSTPDLIDLIPPISSESSGAEPSDSGSIGNPLSVFKLDMVPDNLKSPTGVGSPCPSVHISSQVLGPMSRQECSDLNLVINSHIHQNTDTRKPVDTYDGLGPSAVAEDELLAADPIAEDAFADGVVGDVAAADPAAVADTAAASPASGGTGGSGGSGGNGSGGPWQFPDLKHLFEAMGFVWNGIRYLLGFLRNPYLYIIPFLLFFLLAFFKVIALFPWWIPILVLYVSVKHNTQQKDQITFTKHIHKPIRHPDGWFWNHQTKMWQNVAHFPHTRRIDGRSDIKMVTHLPQISGSEVNLRTWKRRKRL